MIHGKRVVVVMPAYFAEQTLEQTVDAVPMDVVDRILLVDDASTDGTAELARNLGILADTHPSNRGYGGNQKTCYAAALEDGADVIVMVHPDNQYDPGLVPAMASMIALGRYDVVLGSRMHGRGPLAGGMPRYKYVANRLLTAAENRLTGRRLSEYHTGLRAFSRGALERIPWQRNSDDFVFDNQILLQAIHLELEVGELACPARYFPEASSIGLQRSMVYGLGVLRTMGALQLHRSGILRSSLFED